MSGAEFTGRVGRSEASQPQASSAAAEPRPRTTSPDAVDSGGLSLRARLLLLQIAITAVFLLIMGIVSTALFEQHLKRQFQATVLAESTRNPRDIASRPALGVSAMMVTFRPFNVHVLPSRPPATERVSLALATALRRTSPSVVIRLGKADSLFPVIAGPVGLQAAARFIPRAVSGSGRPGVLIVAAQATTVTRQLRGLVLIEMITGGGLLVLLAVGGQWLIGRGLGPLDRMARTANEISARGDLAARMAEAEDQTEVGRLAAAINTMLDRIQHAFGARLSSERKIREFAADASHELRTPLTTIRGYAELYRQGALGHDELPAAMRRIEQEAQRMSTLVAELLELARLDRTSTLDLAEMDLAEAVRDAVADAMAVEPGRQVSALAPPRLIVLADERRIRQVLANLLGNVRAHTPTSAEVAVTLTQIQGGVMIEVADSGPGMTPQDAARAFDRFHRATEQASGSANPDEGHAIPDHAGSGSGLGLSIVQAIATAHGGHATLESRQGRGTRVRIWLPTSHRAKQTWP